MAILVHRAGALGDVILTTPIIRRLRREFPNELIQVVTSYPRVYQNNPHIGGREYVIGEMVKNVYLDLAYEKNPSLHIVEAYMQETFEDLGDRKDLQQELFFSDASTIFEGLKRKVIAIHAARAGWNNRTLPRYTWRLVVDGLRKAGFWPVLIGAPNRDEVPDCEVTRFFGYDILTHAWLINRAVCFVGSDSALLHVAGATNTPIVGIFTCARPATRLPWRGGRLGGRCIPIVPKLDCVGCLARRPAPVTTEYCERGDTACVQMVDPDQIIDAVMRLVG
jgi:ADP-heptose:LPS heptosyltransferase